MHNSDFIICFITSQPSPEYVLILQLAIRAKQNTPNSLIPVYVEIENLPNELTELSGIEPIRTAESGWKNDILLAMRQTPTSKPFKNKSFVNYRKL